MSDKQAWPADRVRVTVQVFWSGDPDDSLVTGYNGFLWDHSRIEEAVFTDADWLYSDGPGDYLLDVSWIPDQIDYSDTVPRVAIPGHLEAEVVDFRPMEEPNRNEDVPCGITGPDIELPF